MPALLRRPATVTSVRVDRSPSSARRRALACAAVAAVGSAAAVPAAATAARAGERPDIRVTNNKQSSLRSYGACRYRVQLGQFGSAAYLQLKLRNASCIGRGTPVTKGADNAPSAMVWTRGGLTDVGVSDHRFVGGPRLLQATYRNGRVREGSYVVCASIRGKRRCSLGWVYLR